MRTDLVIRDGTRPLCLDPSDRGEAGRRYHGYSPEIKEQPHTPRATCQTFVILTGHRLRSQGD